MANEKFSMDVGEESSSQGEAKDLKAGLDGIEQRLRVLEAGFEGNPKTQAKPAHRSCPDCGENLEKVIHGDHFVCRNCGFTTKKDRSDIQPAKSGREESHDGADEIVRLLDETEKLRGRIGDLQEELPFFRTDPVRERAIQVLTDTLCEREKRLRQLLDLSEEEDTEEKEEPWI